MDILDNVRVAKPCDMAWAEMSGDDQVRHCDQCKHNVFNLSGMTSAEARELIQTREGRTCVRFYRRVDGKMLTQDCPVGIAHLRMRCAKLIATGAGLVLFCLALAKIDEKGEEGRLEEFKERARNFAPIRKVIDYVDPPHTTGVVAFPTTPTSTKTKGP